MMRVGIAKTLVTLALAALFACPARGGAQPANEELLVFGAVSLTDVLEEIAKEYTATTGQRVKLSFASSATLARQIESGASVDVFFSADIEWMDYLQVRGFIDRSSRFDIVGNRLALVAPADSTVELKITRGFALGAALGKGRLATGDPDFVPVGRYAKSALTSLGAWDQVADRLVRTESVRAALAFVARGEVPLGIVYETDARVEKGVRVVDLFPTSSHLQIVYPVAATVHARAGARKFVDFLRAQPAQDAFRKAGFQILPRIGN